MDYSGSDLDTYTIGNHIKIGTNTSFEIKDTGVIQKTIYLTINFNYKKQFAGKILLLENTYNYTIYGKVTKI